MAGFDHTPVPFFKRGPAPLALLTFYIALSVALLVVDLRFRSLDLIRQSVSVFVDPLQRVAQTPGGLVDVVQRYLVGLAALQAENDQLKHAQLNTAPNLQRLAHLEMENAHLRKLLSMNDRENARGQVAQILYTARDPFSRKVIVDKGQQAAIAAGQPVIDEAGVVGQVTRVFPFSAEITLITDKDQAIPVQVVRTGMRSVAFGLGNGRMEFKYIPSNADVQVGDLLVTSGLDGIYLPGFPVAKVTQVERDNAFSFARIYCTPVAGVENFGEVMVLDPRRPLPEPPSEAADRGSNGGDDRPLAKKKRVASPQ